MAPERPFDLDKLKSLAHEALDSDRIEWPSAVTPEEARFWLHVYAHYGSYSYDARASMIRKLTKAATFTKPIGLAETKAELGNIPHYCQEVLQILRMKRAWMALEGISLPCSSVIRWISSRNSICRLRGRLMP